MITRILCNGILSPQKFPSTRFRPLCDASKGVSKKWRGEAGYTTAGRGAGSSSGSIAVEPQLTSKRKFLVFTIVCVASTVLGYDAYYFAYVYDSAAQSIKPDRYTQFQLLGVTPVSEDSKIFKFAIHSANRTSELAAISHVSFKDDRLQIQRPYTPISVEQNTMDFLIKRVESGSVSRWLFSLVPGAKVEMRGPILTWQYEPNRYEKLTLLAGGSGIAPMYQLLQSSIANPEDRTTFHLVYANKASANIPLREHLDALHERFPEKFSIDYVVDQDSEEMGLKSGLLTKELLSSLEITPPSAPISHAILVSGPDAMHELLTGNTSLDWSPTPQGKAGTPLKEFSGSLKEMGYSPRQVIPL